MSDDDKELFGHHLRKFVLNKIRTEDLPPGAHYAVNDLMAGQGHHGHGHEQEGCGKYELWPGCCPEPAKDDARILAKCSA